MLTCFDDVRYQCDMLVTGIIAAEVGLLRLGCGLKVSMVTCFNKVRCGRIYGNGPVTNTVFITYIFKVFT